MITLSARKRHDTAYPLVLTLRDANGPVNLTSALSATFTMAKDGAIKFQAAMTILNQTTSLGGVSLGWLASYVDTIGMWSCEVEVLFANGTKATWPSADYMIQPIIEDLDAA